MKVVLRDHRCYPMLEGPVYRGRVSKAREDRPRNTTTAKDNLRGCLKTKSLIYMTVDLASSRFLAGQAG